MFLRFRSNKCETSSVWIFSFKSFKTWSRSLAILCNPFNRSSISFTNCSIRLFSSSSFISLPTSKSSRLSPGPEPFSTLSRKTTSNSSDRRSLISLLTAPQSCRTCTSDALAASKAPKCDLRSWRMFFVSEAEGSWDQESYLTRMASQSLLSISNSLETPSNSD